MLPGLCLIVARRYEAGLGPPDFRVEGAGASGVAGGDVGQQSPPVRQELRELPAPEFAVLAQQAQCRSVERTRLHARDAQGPQPGAQLVGRLSAEGGHEGAVGIDGAVAHPPSRPQREDPGLAGAGAGDHAEEALLRLDRLPLRRGQASGTGEGLPGLVVETVERGGHTGRVPKGCAASTMDGVSGSYGRERLGRAGIYERRPDRSS